MDGIWVSAGDYVLSRWLFLRALGAIYLIAFASLGVQVTGLVGEKGILPAGKYLAAVKKAIGRRAYYEAPTLAWLGSSNRALKLLCILGAVLSAALLFGLQTTPVLALLWLLYLSLVTVGQVFLSFQWDVLLIETGFLSIFLVAPSLLLDQARAAPSPIVILLFRWLLFRLIFMSGVVKLTSGDPTWRNLTALSFHYETQPLPNPLAYWMHRLPPAFQKLSTAFSLFVEVVVPFFYFAPRLLRFAAGGLTVLLMLLILLTGNFAFFNLLGIALAIPLFNDEALQQALPQALVRLVAGSAPAPAPPGWWVAVTGVLAVVLFAAGLLHILLRGFRRTLPWRSALTFLQALSPLRIVNPYGLFAAMTTSRPEIILEGSEDGQEWRAYEFKYKAGDLRRAPPVVAPHQPRLDWQMWFAALGSYNSNPWFLLFAEGLLEGSPEVLSLLKDNPFPERPPVYLRALLYEYHFTTPEEKQRTGDWWKRSAVVYYLPPTSLSS